MMQCSVGLLWAGCREFCSGGVAQEGNCGVCVCTEYGLRSIGIVDVDALQWCGCVVARGKLGSASSLAAADSCQRNCAPVPQCLSFLSPPSLYRVPPRLFLSLMNLSGSHSKKVSVRTLEDFGRADLPVSRWSLQVRVLKQQRPNCGLCVAGVPYAA